MKKSLFFALFAFILTCLFSFASNAEVGSISLEKLGERERPVTDGDISDEIWQSVPVVVINDETCSTSWSYRSLVNGEAELKMLCSDDGLFICAKVIDPTLVLSTGANDVHNDDGVYSHNDDYYGYNGDLFILALDPFAELEANENTRNEKGIWYTFAPHADGSMRVFRSNPAYCDISNNTTASYILKDYGYDFEAFIPLSEIKSDYSLFKNLPEHSESEYFSNGACHTASVLYMDRYVYDSFSAVRSADGTYIDYNAQLKEYSDFHQVTGRTYTVSRWGTTCNMIPNENIEGRLGNGVAAKLHGIYITVDAEHVCTPGNDIILDEADCSHSGKAYTKCSVCNKALTYLQRGFSHNLGDWRVIRRASCMLGIEARYCKDCNLPVYQRTIPAIGSHKDGAYVNPEWVNIIRNGQKRVLYCTMCENEVKADAQTVTLLYGDIDSEAWYALACAEMYNRDLMSGVSSKLFSPETTVTRAMLVQILAKLGGAELSGNAHSEFEDVPDGEWYTAAVCWAYKNKITAGAGGALFAPDKGVTREQLALFMQKFASYCGHSTSSGADMSRYTDFESANDWAKEALKWAVSENIISGTGSSTLSPKKPATRAQIAQVLFSYIK
ncbi:MAG: S-layer homology domain-containing protein [Clostridia bacterium]|nr:S-layer homology domain-containing protein [Clostridia bacterium]